MTVISTKSITGVTSITSPQSDDAVTLHTNDTTQRVSVTTGGMNVTGVLTATSFSGTLDTAAQTNVTSVGTLTGLTVSGDVTFTGSSSNMLWRKANNALRLYDNVQLNFGNSDEGDIYRDSTQMIVNNANGNLKLRSNSIHIAGTSNEKHIVSNTGLGVTVYYNNSARLATTNSGVEVTGTGTFSGDVLIADKIVHTGDTNTAIRFADEDTFTVETGGGERFRIVGVGSFGINNSDPKYTMHFKNAMTSSPSWIHMEVTGSNTTGGGGGIAFDTSATNNASNNSLFLATVSGERSGSGNGSNTLVFKTSKSGVVGDDGSTSSAPRTAMVINEDRNVGIGTTNADALSGFTHSSGSTLVLNNLGSNSNWNGQIRLGNTGSGYLIDHNAASTTTTTFRNIYGATNAAALTKIESGLITFGTGTSYTERLRITSEGYLRLAGTISGSDNKLGRFLMPSHDSSEEDVMYMQFQQEDTFNQLEFGGGSSSYNAATQIILRTAAVDTVTGVERVKITSDGRIGINDTSPNDYEVDICKRTDATDAQVRIYNDATGSSNDSILRLQVAGTSASNYIYFGDGDDANSGMMRYYHTDDSLRITCGAKERFRIHEDGGFRLWRSNDAYEPIDILHSGDHGNGTTVITPVTQPGSGVSSQYIYLKNKGSGSGSTTMNLQVDGSITGASKSFSIPHPLTSLKDAKQLVHASIEGPSYDLIYRGKVTLSSGTATVNIDTVSNMTAGTFVALNRDIQCFTTNETGWDAVKGSVSGNILTITSQNNSSTDTISWMVVGERQDPTIKELDLTDDDGYLIVESDI